MEFHRVVLSKAFNPKRKDPPRVCRQEKTISFNSINTTLLMFKDSRREAQDYIREILPTFLMVLNPEEAAMKLYNSLDGQWLEFDFLTNTLSICSTKKILS